MGINELEFQKTDDGSATFFSIQFNETYHSTHGALRESNHIYIKHGLEYKMSQNLGFLRVGEIGLGTGLNAYLTFKRAERRLIFVHYFAVEAFPIDTQHIHQMSQEDWARPSHQYISLMETQPGVKNSLTTHFQFQWERSSWPDFDGFVDLDLLYYDAFSPTTQPELWSEIAMENAFSSLKPGGVLVTYCAKAYVKRNMKKAGFLVERLPGPPGKLEMTRATKPE